MSFDVPVQQHCINAPIGDRKQTSKPSQQIHSGAELALGHQTALQSTMQVNCPLTQMCPAAAPKVAQQAHHATHVPSS